MMTALSSRGLVAAVTAGYLLLVGACVSRRTDPPSEAGPPASEQANSESSNDRGDPWIVTIAQSVLRGGPHGGQDFVEGVEMALEDARGAVDERYEIRHVVGDILHDRGVGWDAERELEFARRMAADPTVIAYIAPNPSAAAALSLPIMNRAGIVMVGVSNSYPGFTIPVTEEADDPMKYYPSGQRTYVRVIPHNAKHAEVNAQWIDDVGARRVFIIYDEYITARTMAVLVRDAIGKRAIELMSIGDVRATQPSPDTIARRVIDAHADLLVCSVRNGSRVLQIARSLARSAAGSKIPLLGMEYLAAKAAVEFPEKMRVYVTFAGLPSEEFEGRAAEWLAAYEAKYGHSPRNQFGIFAYDAATIVMEALASAPAVDNPATLRREILQRVTGLRSWRGSLGLEYFDDRGDPVSFVFTVIRASPGGWITEKVMRGKSDR